MNGKTERVNGNRRLVKLSLAGISMLLAFVLAGCSTAADGLKVGDRAPEFELVSSDGEQVALADYRGQPVLLYFHMAMG
jgi:cytochrome oxidase Cu insertion factor (SCO1/SenC/PrrC family)